MSQNIGVDFSFFTSEEANKVEIPGGIPSTEKKKSRKLVVSVDGKDMPEVSNPIPGANVAEMDYAHSYDETNNMIRATISQADILNAEIKKDLDDIRASKTLKGKYTYLSNLTSAASGLISSKLAAIKALNDNVTTVHKLEMDRLKALKLDQKNENDDMRMMDIYSAFVNTPVGSYTPATPSIQDITLGVNNPNSGVGAVEMVAANANGGPLTPEQNRMRMESNPNIQTVVRFNQSNGQRYFDVVDKTTGASVPNYPRPDAFLLEDTTIDIHAGIARNRNVNAVWPLIQEGSIAMSEY